MSQDRLTKQIDFILEVDQLKQVYRQTLLLDRTRKENDAEHSWHLALMAILLVEYAADDEIDLLRVVKMVLIHDIVEIDAGDTYIYDDDGRQDKMEREQRAADRLFHILPEDQAQELRMLWEEFEERSTPEARFAATLDRLQPLLHNYVTEGQSWQEHGVTSTQVRERNRHTGEGSPQLWEYAQELIDRSVEKGYLRP